MISLQCLHLILFEMIFSMWILLEKRIDIFNKIAIIYLTGQSEGECSSPVPAKTKQLFIKNSRQLSQGRTTIFYGYNSKWLQSVEQRLRLSSVPHMYA